MAWFRKGGVWLIGATAVLAVGGGASWRLARPGGLHPPPHAASSLGDQSVGALGRIEPENGIIAVGVRSLTGQPSLVAGLEVKEGDYVEVGQVLATLNSKGELDAAWHAAESRVALARAQLEQVKAGAKTGDLAAQQARISRARAELATAEADYRRNQQLYEKKEISASAYDASRLRLDSAQEILEEAQESLRSLAEVRTTDISVAEADLAVAENDALRAKAEFDQSIIRSPASGRVIKICAWPGEEVDSQGLLRLAKTARMYANAEVVESDLPGVYVGQKAIITGDALARPLDGVVERIGMEVDRNRIVNTDPTAYSDTRIVEVKVRLLDPKRAEKLINAEVRVVFLP